MTLESILLAAVCFVVLVSVPSLLGLGWLWISRRSAR